MVTFFSLILSFFKVQRCHEAYGLCILPLPKCLSDTMKLSHLCESRVSSPEQPETEPQREKRGTNQSKPQLFSKALISCIFGKEETYVQWSADAHGGQNRESDQLWTGVNLWIWVPGAKPQDLSAKLLAAKQSHQLNTCAFQIIHDFT